MKKSLVTFKNRKKALVIPFLLTSIFAFSQNGFNDTTFVTGTGVSGVVSAMDLQTDGKILIGGTFTAYNGTPRTNIARANKNGSSDTLFNPGTGANAQVRTIAVQPDGKILVGGVFTLFNGAVHNRIVRLNPDGTIDGTFNVGTGANNVIYDIEIQGDGKIVVVGNFLSFNGVTHNRIVRLNPDGSFDSSFNAGVGANGIIQVLKIQPDGKILLSGDFNFLASGSRTRIGRLNADGTLDTSFNPGTGMSSAGLGFAIQPDGKILVGGGFVTYNGVSINRIARLHVNGSLDGSFNPGTGANNYVNNILVNYDGKILIAGSFTQYNGATHNRIVQLNPDGTVDSGFNTGGGASNPIFALFMQPDLKIVIGGSFNNYHGVPKFGITRITNCPCL